MRSFRFTGKNAWPISPWNNPILGRASCKNSEKNTWFLTPDSLFPQAVL
jgi:hypothetical protein